MLWAPGPWVYVPVALAGAAYAGMQSLPMAMLPDVISHDAAHARRRPRRHLRRRVDGGRDHRHGARRRRCSRSCSRVTGYIESVGSTVVAQPPTAIAGIVLSFSVVPAVLVALSLVPLGRYPLRRGDIEADAAAEAVAP